MKKLAIIFFLMFLVSFVSAGWFDELFTGKIIASNNLIAHYAFEDNVQDSVGTNDGINHGANFVDGKAGKALRFEGGGDYVKIINFNSRDISNEITITVWIKYNGDGNNRDLIELLPFQGDNRIHIHFPWDGKIHWQFGKPYAEITSSPPEIGNWHHFAFVASASQNFIKVYKDGAEIVSESKTINPFSTYAADLNIGGNGKWFRGDIDELKIYNKALTVEEVINEYNLIPCTDSDNDGYSIEGGECGEIDCRDDLPNVYPHAGEICGNNMDEDCNGSDLLCEPNSNCPAVGGLSETLSDSLAINDPRFLCYSGKWYNWPNCNFAPEADQFCRGNCCDEWSFSTNAEYCQKIGSYYTSETSGWTKEKTCGQIRPPIINKPPITKQTVLAFYYMWYAKDYEQYRIRDWHHWTPDNNPNEEIGYSMSLHKPSLGWYSSSDKAVIRQHIKWAKEAGIDGFIISYFNSNWDKDIMNKLITIAEEEDFKITVYLETEPTKEQINYLLDRFGNSPIWYKKINKDGIVAPVFFVYSRISYYKDGSYWDNLRDTIGQPVYLNLELYYSDIYETRYGATPNSADGLHFYLEPFLNFDPTSSSFIPYFLSKVKRYNKDYSLTISPGFDNSPIASPPENPEKSWDRSNGETYKYQWRLFSRQGNYLISLSEYPGYFNDEILITSWNEWGESTGIEPSETWGSQYLDLTYSCRENNCEGSESDFNTDSDSDGVIDSEDKCPNTHSGKVINNKGCVKPRTTKFILSNLDDEYLRDVKLKLTKQDKAKIEFLEGIDIEDLDLDEIIDIEDKNITIRSNRLNKRAMLTFYNVTYHNPQVYKDSSLCLDCNISSYGNNQLRVEVPRFSSYNIIEGPYCGDNSCNGDETCSVCSTDCGSCSTEGSSGGEEGGGGGGNYGRVVNCNQLSYNCGEWGECKSNYQSRTCTNITKCDNDEFSKINIESRNCEYKPTIEDGKNKEIIHIGKGFMQKIKGYFILGWKYYIIISFILLMIILFFIVYYRKDDNSQNDSAL